jgi:hypothetical protein
MKRSIFHAFAAMIVLLIAACSKPVDPKPLPPPPDDTSGVRLKEVAINSLPSPYFHFDYNDSGYVTNLDFAQGFFTYQLQYESKRLVKMTNTRNNDYLLYQYANGQVAAIKHMDAVTAKPGWHYEFTYYTNRQLKQIRWFHFEDDSNDSVLVRKVVLIYYPDGNLSEFDDYRRNGNNEVTWSGTVEFKSYDQGINVDDFYLFKDFFDDVLFLPQVKLQKNNAKQTISSGINNDFKIDYTYQYNDKNVPLVKSYDMLQVRGSDAGKRFTGAERFFYY